MKKPKYEPLKKYFESLNDKKVKLTYEEIENIIGGKLPTSSYKYSIFWSNGGQYQDYAWLEAGWIVKKVVLSKYIIFEKLDESNKNEQLVFIEDLKYEKSNKYEPLKNHLKNSGKDKIVLTYKEIESIINNKLPESAYKYKEWWSNSKHNRGIIWMETNYKVENVKLGESIEFISINKKGSLIENFFEKIKKIFRMKVEWWNNFNLKKKFHKKSTKIQGFMLKYTYD